jgi:hypothetical protein
MRTKIDPLKIKLFRSRIKQSDIARALGVTDCWLSLWLNLKRPWREGMREKVAAYIEEHKDD